MVEINETKSRYSVRRSLHVEHAKYLKKALGGPWRGTWEGVVTLKMLPARHVSTYRRETTSFWTTMAMPTKKRGNNAKDFGEMAKLPVGKSWGG
jgi:hypothetical protein